jgi:hypothetical protein
MPHNLMIADYSVGHTGSVHDSWAFRSTRTYREHEQVFRPGEWMWADSAYPCETWSVSPFKKPARGSLNADQRTFNYHISKVCIRFTSSLSAECPNLQIRIRVEHAIGLLKGRFQSLFQLRIQVYTHRKHVWAIMWVRCCIILHNLIIRLEAGNYNPQFREELQRVWDTFEGENLRRQQQEAFDVESEDETDLGRARREAMSDGQKFRQKIMRDLFNSPTSGAVRRR